MADKQTPNQDMLNEIEGQAPASMHPLLEAAFKYQKQLIIAVCAIVGVTVIYAAYNGYATSAMTTAQAELGAVRMEQNGPEKISKLEGLLNTVPGSVKPAVVLELAQASLATKDYDKAVTYWETLAAEGDDMAYVARMGKAKALLLSGKAADALAELKDVLAAAPEGYAIPINRQIALAAEAAGDNAQALAAYKLLAENNVNDKPFVDYKIAQLESK